MTPDPLIRVMALHALEYCERLFYLEEVEEIRVADKAIYDGRRFHEELPEYVALEQYALQSDTLGIQGKLDCLRTDHGEWIPYEYKKGHARVPGKKEVQAWPSDEVQVGAYALLLEEYFGCTIQEGRVYYAADHRTVVVPLDNALRQRVFSAIERAKQLRSTTERPLITSNERLCGRCSLAPICLPEEERFVDQPDRQTIRLFPEDRDLLDLHIATPGSTVRRSGNTLVIDNKDGEKQAFPIEDIGSITLHGNSQLTTQTIHLCASKGIHIHWVTGGGKYVGSVSNSAGGVQRRLRQYHGLCNDDLKLELARSLVKSKIETQLRYILRLTRGSDKRTSVEHHIEGMREALASAHQAKSIAELRGHEGNCAREYFACFGYLTQDDKDSGMTFIHRNRRPPRDPANALLSFLYSLLYKDCVQAIITVGLDPTVGFYHQPRSAAYPLALDLMELFRVSICDMTAMGSIHRQQWKVEEDFTRAGDQVWLSDSGRRKAIAIYENRKQDTWKHPVIGYSLSYDRTFELETRLLEKEWSGRPGLFAMNRIR